LSTQGSRVLLKDVVIHLVIPRHGAKLSSNRRYK
jgi:hypothetical protein